MRSTIHLFDRIIIRYVLSLPECWRPFMIFVSTALQPAVLLLIPICLIGAGLLHMRSQFILLGCIAISIFLINLLVKMTVRRARPHNEYVRRMKIHTASFPSAHAATSVVCLGLATLLLVHVLPAWLIPGVAIAALCSLLVGISRIYLGAHYPSDVIGGWLLGGAGILAMLILTPF